MGDIAEKEARILNQNRLRREENGFSSKADGSGNKQQDKGKGAGKEVTRDLMCCAPAAWDSRRRLLAAQGSTTLACQGW